jgi:hypothetical protein
MQEITANTDRIVRLDDGSVDIRRMEMMARREQRDALASAFRDGLTAVKRLLTVTRSTRRSPDFRQA